MGLANRRPLSPASPAGSRSSVRPSLSGRPFLAGRPGIAFTAIAEIGGKRVLVSCLASSIEDAAAKAKRLVGEASHEAQKFEMRGEDDDDEKRIQMLWEDAVERAAASISSISLWVGRHDRVPPCPPVGAFA